MRYNLWLTTIQFLAEVSKININLELQKENEYLKTENFILFQQLKN